MVGSTIKGYDIEILEPRVEENNRLDQKGRDLRGGVARRRCDLVLVPDTTRAKISYVPESHNQPDHGSMIE